MYWIIYKITHNTTKRCYIGQTKNSLVHRMACHGRNHGTSTSYITNAILKYGKEAFDYKQIDTAGSLEEINKKESYWISFYNSKAPNGFNLTDGGDAPAGMKHTEETKRKIGEWSKKHHRLSPEGKERIRQSKLGKPRPDLAAFNKSRIGVSLTAEHRAKIGKRGIYHPNYGKRLSEITKAKIAMAHFARHHRNSSIIKILSSLGCRVS